MLVQCHMAALSSRTAEPGTSGSQVWAGTQYLCPYQNPEDSTQQQGPVPSWCLAWASLPCHGKSC